MLEIRPNCEHCGKDLPNTSTEAMICTFERDDSFIVRRMVVHDQHESGTIEN